MGKLESFKERIKVHCQEVLKGKEVKYFKGKLEATPQNVRTIIAFYVDQQWKGMEKISKRIIVS